MLNNYIERLRMLLIENDIEDADSYIDYIEEMVTDRRDNGESEEDILASLEDPEVILATLKEDDLSADIRSARRPSEERKEDGEEKTYVYENIEDIDIDVTDCDVRIYAGSSLINTVTVSRDPSDRIKVRCDDDELSIEQEGFSYALGWPFFKIQGSLPVHEKPLITIELSNEELKSLEFSNVSGRSEFMDLTFRDIEIESVSGSIDIRSCHSRDAEIETVSGSITAVNIGAERSISLQSVSGRIETRHLLSRNIQAESVSGSIDLLIEGNESDYRIDIEKIMKEQHLNRYGHNTLSIETVSGIISYAFTE